MSAGNVGTPGTPGGGVSATQPLTTPSMQPLPETLASRAGAHDSGLGGSDNHKVCVAVDGSGNSFVALQAAVQVLCKPKKQPMRSRYAKSKRSNPRELAGGASLSELEIVHVQDLEVSASAFDLQPKYIEQECRKEMAKIEEAVTAEAQREEDESRGRGGYYGDNTTGSGSSDAPLPTWTFVHAQRFKEGQSVRGTLGFHVNEKARPRFLVTGLIGSGLAGESGGHGAASSGSTMAHALWCTRCTSVVVDPKMAEATDPDGNRLLDRNVGHTWVVAVDGSGRSQLAFEDVRSLCDPSKDSVVVVHILMEDWKEQGVANAAAAAIEKEYVRQLGGMGMDGRVRYECVRVSADSGTAEDGTFDTTSDPSTAVAESLAEFAKGQNASFLAIGIDGAGVWCNNAMRWKAKQRPAPGRTVRFLTMPGHAPCSLLVSCAAQ